MPATKKIKNITIQDGEYTLNLEQVVSVNWDHPRQSADAMTITGEDYVHKVGIFDWETTILQVSTAF